MFLSPFVWTWSTRKLLALGIFFLICCCFSKNGALSSSSKSMSSCQNGRRRRSIIVQLPPTNKILHPQHEAEEKEPGVVSKAALPTAASAIINNNNNNSDYDKSHVIDKNYCANPSLGDGGGCGGDRTTHSNVDSEWGQAIPRPDSPTQEKRKLPLAAGTQATDDDDTKREPTVTTTEQEVEVAIVGGGLAGLAVAIGLQGLGISGPVVIYERAPELRSSSQGLVSIMPNGHVALKTIHPRLPEIITQAGCVSELITNTVIMDIPMKDGTIQKNVTERNMTMFDEYNSTLLSTPAPPLVMIPWSALQQCLATTLLNNNNNNKSHDNYNDDDDDDDDDDTDKHMGNGSRRVRTTCTIVTDRNLEYFEEESDSVLLYFKTSDKSDPEEGDPPGALPRVVVRAKAVVACDGIFSVARRQIVAHDDQQQRRQEQQQAENNDQNNNNTKTNDSPIFFGQLNWGSIVPTQDLPPGIHPPKATRVLFHNLRGKRSHLASSLSPPSSRWMAMLIDAGSGLTFWQIRVANPELAFQLSGNHGRGGLGLPGVKQGLLPLAAAVSADVTAAIAATPEGQIFERSIVGRMPLETWRSRGGRVVLVGDAAHGMHPNIGQGANSAFESVAALLQAIQSKMRTPTTTTTTTTATTITTTTTRTTTTTSKPTNDNTGMDMDQRIEGEEITVDWKCAFASFETNRKPRADLIQQYANLMAMYHEEGTNPLPENRRREMRNWILYHHYEDYKDKDKPLSPEIIQQINAFDPFQQPGVSPLW